MSLPSASTRVSTQSAAAPIATDLIAVWAPCATLGDGTPRLYSSSAAVLAAHGSFEGDEYLARHFEDTGKQALLVPLPIATAGVVKRSESIHTGTGRVTIAVGSSGALKETHGIAKVTAGGTVGTDTIILTLSLDGGVSYKTVRLGTATTYTIPYVGLVITFGVGTLVAGDTILEFESTAPMFDSSGITTGKAGLVAQQKLTRTWLFVGDVSTLALGQAIETAVNAYETANERYTVAKFQARDRRILEASKLRCAAVGTASLTFAEVGGTGDTITRASGSFVTDGFAAGDYIRVTGTASNNVSGKITGVSATVLTLDTTDLAAETIALGTARITGEASLVFAGGGTTITRNSGSWVTEGFAVGDTVTISGSASNDGTAIITTLSATVMTCAASVFVAETAGITTCSITLTESETAWIAALDTLFSAITSSKRVDIGAGRLTKVSPITGYTCRRPVQWADSIRNYQHDVRTATWWKALGALTGWGIDGEHDERVTAGCLAARFTCARTWGNGPSGAFIAESLTREVDGSLLSYTHNVEVSNVAQSVCQRTTEDFAGQVLVLTEPNGSNQRFATKSSLAILAAKVNSELQRNMLSDIGGEGQRASSVKWTPATDDDFAVADTTLHGSLALGLNGTIVHISTTGKVF